MAADYAVSIAMRARDGLTAPFKKMGAAVSRFGTTASKSFDKANRSSSRFKSTLGAILSAGAISRGTNLLGRGIRSITEEFVSFDDAITKAGAKFPEMAKRGSEEFERLEASARDIGAKTKFSATEAGEGFDFLAMAGFNLEQSMAALPQVTNLAVVADTDLARATDIASDALGSFGLAADDSAERAANLGRVNDVFAKTVTSANTDIEMLFEAMKDGGPVITGAGQSIETFAALTGTMANASIKGSKAGTTLKNMFLNLQAPVPAAQKVLKKLKMELIDEEGKLKDITEILGDFNEKTAKMGKAQKAAAINAIFGKRAIAGVSVLLAQGEDKLKAYRQTLIDSKGSAQEMADTIGKSLGNRLKTLRSAAIETGFKFIDAFKDQIPGAIDSAVEAVRKFNVKGVIDAIKDVVYWVKAFVATIKPLTPLIVALVAAKVAYVVITKAIVAIQAVRYFLTLASATTTATGAQTALNVAMTANPIGVIVMAVALLIGAIVALAMQWREIREIWRWVVDEIGVGINDLKIWFNGWSKLVEETITDAFNTVSTVFSNAWKDIKNAWAPVGTWFAELWQGIEDKFFGMVKRIKAAGAKIKGFFSFGQTTQKGERGFGAPAPPTGSRLPATEAPEKTAPRVAPNREDVAAQNIQFRGKLTVAGAPEGSTIESSTIGAPPVQTEMAGANI